MNNYKISYFINSNIKLLFIFCALVMPSFLSLSFGNKTLASACEPDTNNAGAIAAAKNSEACQKEHIQDYLANQKCTDLGSGSADSMERAFAKCKEDLADDASSIFESCKSLTDANAKLACWANDGNPVDPPADTGNPADTPVPKQNITEDSSSNNLHTGTEADKGLIYSFVLVALTVIGALAGVAIVGSFVVAGIQYATAGDNPGAVTKAKTRIAYTLIVMVVYAMLYYVAVWLIPS